MMSSASLWEKAVLPTAHRARRGSSAIVLCVVSLGCSELFTSLPDDADLLDAPLPGLSPEEGRAFARGDAQFERAFAPNDGLGPIFNNVACSGCHPGDGRGRPENALVRFGEPPDLAAAAGGPQLQDRAIPGAVPERLSGGIPFSVRLPPPVFGVGLIEAIPESALLALVDSLDANRDGISGRPNWVRPPPWIPFTEPGGAPGLQVGRFSRKAQVSTLLQQVVEAYHQDMGITSEFLPVENVNPGAGVRTESADVVDDPEIPTADLMAVIDYIRMLAPPAPGAETEEVLRGQSSFSGVGCAGCHVPELRTGPHAIAALSNQPVRLYSDLLLHDMGDALADNRVDRSATGKEWRTAPLWGLRVMSDFLNGDAFFMHDGRATNVPDAITLHGGEAAAARDAFLALSEADQAALVTFVESR